MFNRCVTDASSTAVAAAPHGNAGGSRRGSLHGPQKKALSTTLPPSSASIDAVDPVARAVINIPEALIVPTRGLLEFREKPGSRDISLCCLYQRGKCRADGACRQVHADRAFVAKERSRLNSARATCCAACAADPAAAAATSPRATIVGGRAVEGMPSISTMRLLPTVGLRNPAAATTVEWGNVCRLQLQDACKYGDSCRNVHICPKLGKMLLARAAVNVNPVVPDSVREAAAGLDAFDKAPSCATAMTALPAVEAASTDNHHSAAASAASGGAPPAGVSSAATGAEASVYAAETAGEQPPSACPTAATSIDTQPATAPVTPRPTATVAPVAHPSTEPRTAPPVPPMIAAPRALRAQFPTLDQGSLKLRDANLDGLVFNLPTLASIGSEATTDRFDLFSPSPTRTAYACSPVSASPSGGAGYHLA